MNRPVVLMLNSNSDGPLAATRALRASGYHVVGADQRLPFGLRSRYLRTNHRLDFSCDLARYENNLLDLVDRVRPDVIFSTNSKSTEVIARCLDKIRSTTSAFVPEHPAFMAAFDKKKCAQECHDLGIACPSVFSFEEATARVTCGEKVIVKPSFDAGNASGVACVDSLKGLTAAIAYCEKNFDSAIIQEYIPGSTNCMKMVVLLFSQETQLACAFTSRKIREWPRSGGTSATSVSTSEPDLVDQVLPFFRKWQWRGPAEVELKYDARDGQHKVIEINPRFPAYLRFIVSCGLDMPTMACQIAMSSPIDKLASFPPYECNQKYISPAIFMKTVLHDFRQGGSKTDVIRQVCSELCASSQIVKDMLKDPMPLFGRVLQGVGNAWDLIKRN